MTKTSQVLVPDEQALESAVLGYIAHGFTVQHRTPDSVVMFKKKEFSVLWAVIGLLICALPLIVYLIIYASQSDQMIEIRVGSAPYALPAGAAPLAGAAATSASAPPTFSDDGHFWWNGTEWRPVSEELPPGTQRSEDGHYYWNGSEWKLIPGAGEAAAQVEASAPAGAAPEKAEDGRTRLTFDAEPGESVRGDAEPAPAESAAAEPAEPSAPTEPAESAAPTESHSDDAPTGPSTA